jgi:hypothetical protein
VRVLRESRAGSGVGHDFDTTNISKHSIVMNRCLTRACAVALPCIHRAKEGECHSVVNDGCTSSSLIPKLRSIDDMAMLGVGDESLPRWPPGALPRPDLAPGHRLVLAASYSVPLFFRFYMWFSRV